MAAGQNAGAVVATAVCNVLRRPLRRAQAAVAEVREADTSEAPRVHQQSTSTMPNCA